MTDPALKTCPFCGGEAKTEPIRDGRQGFCQKCDARGAPVYHRLVGPEYTNGRAIEAWNTRAPVDDLCHNGALFEALRHIERMGAKFTDRGQPIKDAEKLAHAAIAKHTRHEGG